MEGREVDGNHGYLSVRIDDRRFGRPRAGAASTTYFQEWFPAPYLWLPTSVPVDIGFKVR